MKITSSLIPIFLLGLCAIAIAETVQQQCSSTSSGAGQLSDADFWKGVDGAQFIDELTDDNHDQYVQDNPKAFIMYYTTWCGYSKDARKGFGGAAKKLNAKIKFGAVDCDKASDACNQADHAVPGYPTFYFFKDGAWNDQYQGQRTTKAFTSYLSKK